MHQRSTIKCWPECGVMSCSRCLDIIAWSFRLLHYFILTPKHIRCKCFGVILFLFFWQDSFHFLHLFCSPNNCSEVLTLYSKKKKKKVVDNSHFVSVDFILFQALWGFLKESDCLQLSRTRARLTQSQQFSFFPVWLPFWGSV